MGLLGQRNEFEKSSNDTGTVIMMVPHGTEVDELNIGGAFNIESTV